MPETPDEPPVISPYALSDALVALGAYSQLPDDRALAAAAVAEGKAALTVRLANALYGAALAHVMKAERVAGKTMHDAAWHASGADAEGVTILLHYTAIRLAQDLQQLHGEFRIDPGTIAAAVSTAQALSVLVEACTIRSLDDPRADQLNANLAAAGEHLTHATERINTMLATGRTTASFLNHPDPPPNASDDDPAQT